MEKDRENLARNILITSEVAELLDCSTKAVNHYVNNEGLRYLRKTANGLMFLREDVENFKSNRSLHMKSKSGTVYFDNSGTTSKSIDFYKKHKDNLKEIYGVYMYFNDIDPIVDGYYENIGSSEHPELQKLANPHMVIKDTEGNAIWLGGCNCGYGGEGPGGSIRILRDLGILTDEIEALVRSYDVVKIVKNQQGWEPFKRDGIVKRKDMFGRTDAYADLYLLENNLVLVQSRHFGWDSNPIEILNKYIEFIPSPTEITIFSTTEQAREYGYFIKGSGYMHRDEVYPVIIKDYTGRQLWLSPYLDLDDVFKLNDDVVKIVDILGFDIKEDSLTDTAKKWVNMFLNKRPPEPITIHKKKTS
jgi:hypothetical protein